MNPISTFVWKLSANARKTRAEIFRSNFSINKNTKILDLGSENGVNISNVLQDADFAPENIFIADIDQKAVNDGYTLFGFRPVLVKEDRPLPFEDGFFDIVYCSSVIEHTTVPKPELWNWRNGKAFREASWKRQKTFAEEIVRLGKQYFVQTPSKTFPIESHTWLPFLGYLPREIFLPVLRLTNRFWIKAADPDFNLLKGTDMRKLFPDAEILEEKKFGLTKSIMAIHTYTDLTDGHS